MAKTNTKSTRKNPSKKKVSKKNPSKKKVSKKNPSKKKVSKKNPSKKKVSKKNPKRKSANPSKKSRKTKSDLKKAARKAGREVKKVAKTDAGRAGIGGGIGALALGPLGAVAGAGIATATKKKNPAAPVKSYIKRKRKRKTKTAAKRATSVSKVGSEISSTSLRKRLAKINPGRSSVDFDTDKSLDQYAKEYIEMRKYHLDIVTSPSSSPGDIASAQKALDDAERRLILYADIKNMDPNDLGTFIKHAAKKQAEAKGRKSNPYHGDAVARAKMREKRKRLRSQPPKPPTPPPPRSGKLARGKAIPVSNPKSRKSRSANPGHAPEWKRIINRCQKLWDQYCDKPTKKNLRAVLDHLEEMKSSKSKKVKDERSACLRAANKEAKRLRMK